MIWKLLDTCSEAAAELENEGFEKEIFQQLRESSPDRRYDLVSQYFSLSSVCPIIPKKNRFFSFY